MINKGPALSGLPVFLDYLGRVLGRLNLSEQASTLLQKEQGVCHGDFSTGGQIADP